MSAWTVTEETWPRDGEARVVIKRTYHEVAPGHSEPETRVVSWEGGRIARVGMWVLQGGHPKRALRRGERIVFGGMPLRVIEFHSCGEYLVMQARDWRWPLYVMWRWVRHQAWPLRTLFWRLAWAAGVMDRDANYHPHLRWPPRST